LSTPYASKLSKGYQCRGKGSKSKYKNEPISIGSENYRSGLESEVHATLKLMERGGLIRNIRREQCIELFPGQTHKIDFMFFDIKRDTDIFLEAKGDVDPTWAEKLKAYRAFSSNPLQVWTKAKGRVGMNKEYPVGRYTVIEKDLLQK
jgi:hypothetical protein